MLMTRLGRRWSCFSTLWPAGRPRPSAGKQQSDSKKIAFVTNTIPHSSIMLAKLRHSLSGLPMDAAPSAWPFIFLDPAPHLTLFSPLPFLFIPLFSIFSHLILRAVISVRVWRRVNEPLLFLLSRSALKDAEQQRSNGGSALIKYSNLLSSLFLLWERHF